MEHLELNVSYWSLNLCVIFFLILINLTLPR